MKRLASLVASLATIVAACTPTGPRASTTPVRLGMDKADLLATYGPPLRTGKYTDGTEDWFYNFGEQQQRSSQASSESTSTDTERSISIRESTSITATMRPEPIHLSPEGEVVGKIPQGQVMLK